MKSWKSYFLDFAMVFLAVFLGFWAENFRSQIQEEKKVEQIKQAIVRDMKKDILQLNDYVVQANYNLSMIDRMDSLILEDPDLIDQQDFYNTMVNYSVAYLFTPSDKSLKQAEEMGVIQNEGNDSLSFAALKYNYFLLDLKFTEQLLSQEYQNYLKDIVPNMTEPDLYRQVWRFPRKTLEPKLGVKAMDLETKKRLRYFFANVSFYYDAMQVNADSMELYGRKMIRLIQE
ncbi:MAG: hypothetical protein FJX97_05580 [Bacteroidetes bacterium]|nr:hypothetical protein [Bacteroidota bacterium]